MKLKYYIPTNISITNNLLFKAFLVCFLLLFIIYNASAQPTISIINNSKTNTSITGTLFLHGIFINNSESITFFASTNNISNTWHWRIDNVLQSNNFNNITTSWSSGTFHYVQVNANNSSGTSNNLTWGINVYPAMATSVDAIQSFNETPNTDLETGIAESNLTKIIEAPISVYVNIVGIMFYAFIWFIAVGMMWTKQQSMNIPTVIGIIFGGLIVTFLPPQYQLVSQVIIAFGIFAIIYVFFKGRG